MAPVSGSILLMNCSTPTTSPPLGAIGTVSMETVGAEATRKKRNLATSSVLAAYEQLKQAFPHVLYQ